MVRDFGLCRLMGHFDHLPTLADRPRFNPQPKGIPAPLAKIARKKTKLAQEKDFRAAVWARDQSRSRASKKPLAKSGTAYERVGEVHHVIPRSLAPERIFDVSNGLLLSKAEHAMAETACPNDPAHRLLDIVGPDDRGQPQTFIFRDASGKELRRRVG